MKSNSDLSLVPALDYGKMPASSRSQESHLMKPLKSLAPLLLVIAVTVASSVLAVTPAPRGGYPNENTALGEDALFSLAPDSTGQNTAIGFEAMYKTTYGSQSVAVGDGALFNNTVGENGVAIGYQALYSNTTGGGNVGIGAAALYLNTTGFSNVGLGTTALVYNTTGNFNTAVGDTALTFSATGSYNTAVGAKAIAFNSTGRDNAALGYGALNKNSTGSNTVGIGSNAGAFVTSGSNNISVGYYSGTTLTTGSNNIQIGHVGGSANESNTIRLGTPGTQTATYIAGIRETGLGGLRHVGIDANGQLGVRSSSARFKEAIAPMGQKSEVIMGLRPVSFRYKKELDPQREPQFGLVAEEVAKVAPELVMRNQTGQPLSVRYEEINAMLLNEFLKEHEKVTAREKELAELKAQLGRQQAGLDALATQMQKVSARLEASEHQPRLVVRSD